MTVVGFPDAEPEQTALGARLKRWRTERGKSLEELAAATGIALADLRRVEAGRARLDSAGVSAVTQALGLPIWALQSDTPAY